MNLQWNEIKNKDNFYKILRIEKKYITYLLYVQKTDSFYVKFEIPKKKGGTRTIKAPKGKLKSVQKNLASALDKHYSKTTKKNTVSHAYLKSKNTITNAKIHRNKKIVLNIDLKDFFESFHFGRVKGFFEKNKNFKVPTEVAIIIANITCFEGSLPQGSPLSPIITNLICQIFDNRILKLAKKYGLDYTRYADDLTFSTNNSDFKNKYELFMKEIKKEIEKNGFKINNNKTRIQFKNSRQTVTGVIVNKKINIPKEYSKTTRAMAHSLYTNGEFYLNEKKGSLNQLEGIFSYINQFDKYNNINLPRLNLHVHSYEYQKNLYPVLEKKTNSKETLSRLNKREKEYQKFLFYKYFYNPEKPVIITEGKTDIDYLKSALKNLNSEYPNLIEKNSDGKFIYKIQFLNRTNRLRYFFNFSKSGADAMQNLSFFFTDKGDAYPNLTKIFNIITNSSPSKPVIFIFDNELYSSKPLSIFKNIYFPYKKEFPKNENNLKNRELNEGYKLKEDNLKLKYWTNINDNLYVVSHPQTENGKIIKHKENLNQEIEDLFHPSTLEKEINGKKFNRKLDKDKDSDTEYGKKSFSQFILKNYKDIDFSNFKPLLNAISKAIEDFDNNKQ
jgi:hypothetical protein